MSNVLVPAARKAFADADIDLLADTIKLLAVDDDYVFSAAHDFLNDIAGGDRVATVTLSGKTTTDGYFDSSDPTFTAVPAGDPIAGLWIYRDSGVESTSRLIAFYDTLANASPISTTPTGVDIDVVVNSLGWFRL